MKRIIFILILLFTFSTIVSAQNTLTSAQQIQQLKNELAKKQVLLEAFEEKYRKEVIKNAVMNGQIQGINKSIDRATIELQKGYDSGKLNYEELRLMGFNIVVDSSNVYQRPKPNNNDKKK